MGPPKFIFNKILGDVNAAVVGPLHQKPTGQWPTDFRCSGGMFEIILVKGFIKFFIFTKCH